MFEIIQAAGWPIWPLILCSVVALAIIVERLLALKRSRVIPKALLQEARTASTRQIPPPDVVDKLEQNSPLGAVLASALRVLRDNPHSSEQELRQAMQNHGRLVSSQLDKYLPALATIASAAPLLGLLGTVIGMIEIFASQSGIDSGVVSGDPARLSHGISIALYNTAFGLIVAIPALMFWRFFKTRVDSYVLELEVAAENYMQFLLNGGRS